MHVKTYALEKILLFLVSGLVPVDAPGGAGAPAGAPPGGGGVVLAESPVLADSVLD